MSDQHPTSSYDPNQPDPNQPDPDRLDQRPARDQGFGRRNSDFGTIVARNRCQRDAGASPRRICWVIAGRSSRPEPSKERA